MPIVKLKVTVKRRWWVTPYIWTLSALCVLMGTEPDCEKAAKFLGKWGYRIRAEEVE